MKNKIKIPSGGIGEVADYKEQIIEDYRDNPFIEALPEILTKEEVIHKLTSYPPFNEEERHLDVHYRYHIVQRLFQYFQPLSIHIDLESRISRMIRQGYLARNPFNTEYKKGLHDGYEMIQKKSLELTGTQGVTTTAYGFTIIGASGMGKSLSIGKILSLYPQVIIHSNYKGIPFSQYQVTWMKIDCPHSGSLKELCINFLITIDSILGTDYYKKSMRGNSSANTLLPVICQISRRCGLGMLIIDEIQSLSLAKSGGAEKMLNFFMTLINTIGVPVVLIGTNKAMSVLQSQFRQARRGSGQGDMLFDRVKSKDEISWNLFIEGLFEYQWIRKPCPFNKEISDILYEESQGIFDIAIKLFIMAQVRAMATNKEEITPKLIRNVAKENLKLVKPMLDALKKGNIAKIAQYEDIAPIDFDEFMNQQISNINLDRKIKEIQQSKKRTQIQNERVKEEAILRLFDLDIEPNIAKKYIDLALKDIETNEDINEIVKLAYRMIIESDIEISKKKQKTKKVDEYGENDLRYIIKEGKKEKLSAYESLKNAGYIKAPQENFLKIG